MKTTKKQMTFQELKNKLGDQNLVEADWSQHECGGWIYKTACVSGNAKIFGIVAGNAQICGNVLICINARVYGDAQIYGNAQICGNAQVCGDAEICGNARVYGNVLICGEAQIYDHVRVYGNVLICGNVQIYGNVRVYGNAQISGNVQIYGNVLEKSPLFIAGPKHNLFNSKRGFLMIGFREGTFDWWLENFREFAEEEGYSESEISEYYEYIKLFKVIGK